MVPCQVCGCTTGQVHHYLDTDATVTHATQDECVAALRERVIVFEQKWLDEVDVVDEVINATHGSGIVYETDIAGVVRQIVQNLTALQHELAERVKRDAVHADAFTLSLDIIAKGAEDTACIVALEAGLAALRQQCEQAEAENARLREMVREAYGEGQGSVGWSGSTPFKDSSVAFDLTALEGDHEG